MLKTARQTDEHGAVILDPRMPQAVQASDAEQERWLACANIAMLITGLPLESMEVGSFASVLYSSDVPTHRADLERPPLEEADNADDLFRPHLHPRDRRGRWRDTPDRPRRILPKALKKRTPASPVISREQIRAQGLDKNPEPSPLALELLNGHPTTARRWYAASTHSDEDSVEHPPYARARRITHDKIVGGELAVAVGSLLGDEHRITEKLAAGGRLTREEKEVVAKAAHNARSGEPPEALFMAGGPAAGKSTALEDNPELEPEHRVMVNADRIKESLPEFGQLRAAKDRYAAFAVHLESGDIAARLAAEAEALGLNVVIDGTGDSEPPDFIRQLQRKHDGGYDVSILYATTSTDEAIARAIQRAQETGRFVPIPVIREQHWKVSRNFEYVVDLPWLEHIDVFDDSGHIGTKQGGFVPLNPQRMKEFRDKAMEGTR